MSRPQRLLLARRPAPAPRWPPPARRPKCPGHPERLPARAAAHRPDTADRRRERRLRTGQRLQHHQHRLHRHRRRRGGGQHRPLAALRPAAAPRHRRRRHRRAGAAVLNLNLHPDHFFGNRAGRRDAARHHCRRGETYADNLYRLCGAGWRAPRPAPAGAPPARPFPPRHARTGAAALRRPYRRRPVWSTTAPA